MEFSLHGGDGVTLKRRLIMKLKRFLALALLVASLNAFGEEVIVTPVKIPQALLERHSAACPAFASERGKFMTRTVETLPGSESSKSPNTLYVLGCELYAYNSRERAYIVDSYGDIRNVALAEVSADGAITASIDLMGAGFDPDTLTLGTFQKGRGIGDCGSAAIYKYDSLSEKFVLLEARIKEACDGDFESEWPVVYSK